MRTIPNLLFALLLILNRSLAAAGETSEGTRVIDLVDVHPTNPPLLKVTVNGRPTKFELARGASEASLAGAWARGREQQITLALEPGSLRQGANEKAVMEGMVKYARLNHFVPVPQVRDLTELNTPSANPVSGRPAASVAGPDRPQGPTSGGRASGVLTPAGGALRSLSPSVHHGQFLVVGSS